MRKAVSGVLLVVGLLSVTVFVSASTADISKHLKEGNFEDALAINAENKKADPRNIDHIREEAAIYKAMAKKDEDNKAKHLQMALLVLNDAYRMVELSRDRAKAIDVINDRASIYFDMGNYKAVEEQAAIVLRLDPNNVYANYHMGNALQWTAFMIDQNNQPEHLVSQAVLYYERAIQNNKKGLIIPYAYFFAGVDRFRKRDLDVSHKYLATWLVQNLQRMEVLGESLSGYEVRWVETTIEMLDFMKAQR